MCDPPLASPKLPPSDNSPLKPLACCCVHPLSRRVLAGERDDVGSDVVLAQELYRVISRWMVIGNEFIQATASCYHASTAHDAVSPLSGKPSCNFDIAPTTSTLWANDASNALLGAKASFRHLGESYEGSHGRRATRVPSCSSQPPPQPRADQLRSGEQQRAHLSACQSAPIHLRQVCSQEKSHPPRPWWSDRSAYHMVLLQALAVVLDGSP